MPASIFSPVNPLLLNLARYVRLSTEDRRALAQLEAVPLLSAKPRGDLIREGEKPGIVRLVVSGWACRYKDLPDGRRQVVGFFVPGDFCDLNVYILQQMDHSIAAISAVRYLAIPPEQMERLTRSRPRVGQALLWHHLVEASIQREWLLNIGQRSALERLAHLLVELFLRVQAVGLVRDDALEFPLTQTDLAEATGLSAVHLNRTLQELRRGRLVELGGKTLRVLDLERLMRLSMFNENYLHLSREGRHLDAHD